MKKALSLLLAVSFLALMIVSVTGCNLFKPIDIDEVKTTLKNAGYTVTVMTGDEYVETDGAVAAIGAYELEKYLYAVKGEDVIHIFFFVDISTASFNSDFINFDNMLGGQNNEVIYRGTRQAIKDAGL
ncbi:MAG: hypothetical protein J5860_02845 [Clostridia bacterium]|nr:hypothetical protein [Clostridia bacterium]MBO4429692.1 hypothetical protein [Clostridia bacterium]